MIYNFNKLNLRNPVDKNFTERKSKNICIKKKEYQEYKISRFYRFYNKTKQNIKKKILTVIDSSLAKLYSTIYTFIITFIFFGWAIQGGDPGGGLNVHTIILLGA